uniref:Uncharacterized protein n=1 Tax=Anguilla anguilla TaxID=7936 RepID=A0A0E9R624_ANGAN
MTTMPETENYLRKANRSGVYLSTFRA